MDTLEIIGRSVVALICLALLTGLGWVLYWLATLPSRRRERARQFIFLLEVAVAEGRSPEQILISAAHSLDPSLSVRLQLLTAYMEEGLSLQEAIEQVPSLLPPNLRAMIRVGLQQDRLATILPAARRAIDETIDPDRGGLAAVMVGLALPSLAGANLIFFLSFTILPKFRTLFSEMSAQARPLPALTEVVFDHAQSASLALSILVPVLVAVLFGRTAGSRLGMVGLDALRLILPWNRLRARRDFSGLLALQLDAGVREEDAVRTAADATGNSRIRRRAKRATTALAQGVSLPDAIAHVDDSPGFIWRLRNALARPGSLSLALHHWILDLDDRARRNELFAGQCVATVLILTNSAVIGAFIAAIFLALLHILEGALLW